MSFEGFFGPNEGSLVDMVQMWGLAKTSGVLTIKSGKEDGEVHFFEGMAVWAKAGKFMADEDAIYHILAMEEGKFRFVTTSDINNSGAFNCSFQKLIMEGMRRLDHLKNEKKIIDDKMGFIPYVAASPPDALTDEEKIFLSLVNGKSNLEKIFNHCGLGLHKSFEVYTKLSSKGLIGLRKVRVLVVDDQGAWRKVVSNMLLQSPHFEIAGAAEDGVEALKMLSELKPDVMTLDLEMPRMDGIKTLYWMMSGGYDILLKSEYGVDVEDTYRCPVVVISAIAHKMAPATLDALMGGASGYITKPSQLGTDSILEQQKRISKTVIMASQVDLMKSRRIKTCEAKDKSDPSSENATKLVCVGASTVGGLTSLMQFVPQIPSSLDAAVFVMIDDLNSVEHARSFAEFLDRHSDIKVKIADRPMLLSKGCVYVCSAGHLVQFGVTKVENKLRTACKVSQAVPSENGNSFKSLDEMLVSAAKCKGFEKRVGVVLAGDGLDGKVGYLQMAKTGDKIFAQDFYSSLNPVKPENVANTGVARIVPLGAMVRQIITEIGRSAE